MRVRVFLGLLAMLLLAPTGAAIATVPPTPPPTPPPVTFNEFLPEDRALSECISAVPKPGCGSEARGGWHQTLVLLAIVMGIAVIAWRIIVSARTARAARGRQTVPVSDRRTPDATIAPGVRDDDRAP